MYKLFEKNPLWFALGTIGAYVLGSGAADGLSDLCGIPKSITLLFHLALSVLLLCFLFRHKLWRYYGIYSPITSHHRFLWYLPLALMASCNLWFAPTLQYHGLAAVCYVGSMVCVGFLEELIFRGLLFRAMEQKTGHRAAILVSSLSFGLGHLINLATGNADSLLQNLCQVVTAICIGFLFVVLFDRGGSLLPCILTHSAINGLSVLVPPLSDTQQLSTSLVLVGLALSYLLVLHLLLPKRTPASETT